MYKLLNRFAWVISIIIALQFSFFIDNDGPFDEEGFIVFIIVLVIVKIFILSGWYIKSRLEFFASSLNKNYIEKENTLNLEEINELENKPLELKKEKVSIEIIEDKPFELKEEKRNKKVIEEKPSKIVLAIKLFFSENLLAKLGGILVFLGVLFLLGLVYNNIGPVGKLIIGFAIGFSVFLSGVFLEKKGIENEGKILLGIGILINFLVILGGRYLIGDNINNSLLSIGTTFIFLIFNTAFAVLTSLVYKSRTLLLFSFIFAYLNHLLIGGSSDNPYTLIGYSLIVSAGGLYLSLIQKNKFLTTIVFVLANILILLAPFNLDLHFIIKIIASTIISISSILIINKIDKKFIVYFLGISYLFISLLIGTGNNILNDGLVFISYMINIMLLFFIGIYSFLKTAISSILYILILPILIVSGITLSGDIFSLSFALSIIVIGYIIAITLIKNKVSNIAQYIIFGVLGLYIFLNNSILNIESISLSNINLITTLIVTFIFIFTSYFLSTKKDLGYLYSIGTIIGAISLAPLIQESPKILTKCLECDGGLSSNINVIYSIISIIIFLLSNWLSPFINKNLIKDKSNIKNLLIGLVIGLIFTGYQLFNYGDIYFPGVSLGFAFTILAIIYFIMSYLMINKIGIDKIKKAETSKNIIYSYVGITISIFTLSIALVFSNYDVIISSIWLFEATILFYFFNKTKEVKIFFAGLILFFIGIIKLGLLIDFVETKDFIFLIPFSLIAISFILNLEFLKNIEKSTKKISHDLLHIIGLIILAILLLLIIPNTGLGWSLLGISIFIAISGVIYGYYNSKILKYFLVVLLASFSIYHIGDFDSINRRLDYKESEYLIILQYISTILITGFIYVYNKINKSRVANIPLNIIFALYLITITSLYIYDIFETTFAVTIYWGVTASIILQYGISKNIIKIRTIGLYLISLTALKVFLYDIWFGIDDAVSRVVALIIIGILFIILSTRYTKKYGNNIAGEFSLKNLKENSLNQKIKEIKSEDIKSIQFIFSEKKVSIRATNLIKITLYIINKYGGKTVYEKDELKQDFDYIKQNFKSDLPKNSYDKIVDIMNSFVKTGGEVKLNKK